ncbi:MAG TPA: peptidase S9, prolyl oligopeptidase [Candidatus Marinimicrobia bacterium]|jgi:protease II|nr:prolyl oligopeptidase family serine peptidase [Candidatus Neomarinimicrobiota bacterium]MDP7331054.1 prolyl oligopeptidase family serine peptidase [Candidatus Neomarinimicrobiota bacterium]HBR86376.1 peptidase S9, prolyl oligopeptidase [Candidatus Neomarinimicrobiota bacterium]|tara:strand:- start:145 stop:2055 length:1911 start_codon:yes stop_codon:yes gene_type:complete
MLRIFSIIFLIISLGNGGEVKQIGNLIIEEIPDIPEVVQERTRQYQNVRSAWISSWNPSGEGMLISTRFAETSQLHFLKEPMGMRQQITFFDEPVGGGSFCPNQDVHGFLFSKDAGGSEYYQLFFFDMDNGSATMLTDGTSRNGLGPWSNSGEYFAFSSNMGNGTDMYIYIHTLSGDKPVPVVEKPGYYYPIDWSPDDTKLLVGKYVSINESYLYIVDVRSQEMNQVNPMDKKISYGSAQFSKNGKGIYFTSDEGTEFRHLRYYEISSGQQSVLTSHIPWDARSIELTDDGKLLAYVTNEDAISTLHVMYTSSRRELRLPELPIGQISGLEFHPDSRQLALVLNTPQSPGDTYVLDIRSRKLVRWTASEIGGLNTQSFVIPELVHTKSFDDLTISGFLYKPNKPGPHPVVVYIHGGPESQFRPGFSSTFQYWVNELGLAILATNVRGSAGYGKTFVQLDNGFKRENSVKDIGAFLDWIESQSDLDADRVAVYGGSYGGYMVLASMTHYNNRLKAGVDNVGISNFVTFLTNTKAYRRDLRRAEYGDERDPEMYKFLQEISPTNNAEKITKPMLIAQGQNDPRVPVTEAEQMRDIIRKNGGEVWYLVALDEGHGFRKKTNRNYYYNALSLFWEEFLLK